MQWLTPLTAVYAAAVTVPLLLLLYFLKLKRAERLISTTLLWKRAVQDLQVNAPFQRIRRNILLFLQMLLLIAILLALGKPVLSLTTGPGRRYVLLIDRSASMSAIDAGSGGASRLDTAKQQAKEFVRSLRSKEFFSLSTSADQVMVIAFDTHAKVMCNFTSDKPQLLSAIDTITAGHNRSLLSEAVAVARAFAQSPGVEANNRSSQEQAQLVLFSDGRIQDADQVVVSPGEMIFNRTGKSGDNIAITAMQAKRSYENPEQVSVFATLANYGTEQVTTDVQLSLNEDVRAVRSVPIPPRNTAGAGDANKPGKVAINLTLTRAEAGILEVRQLRADALSCDDAAWAILAPPKRLSVLLVTAGNVVLESVLRACPLARFEICSPSEFEQMDHALLSVEQPFDAIVLDNFSPAELPRCRYLVFGRPPDGIDVSVSGQLENQVIVDWRTRHAVLKYVNLVNLFAAKCYKMDLPRDADVLAEFNETPAIALLRRGGSIFLLAGFDVMQSNWPFEPSFVLFCYNALGFLGTEFGQEQQNNLQVGQPIVVDGLSPDTEAVISGPSISQGQLKANPSGSIRLPATDRVGVYNIELPDQQPKFFAVNLLDSAESNIEPVDQISLSGEQVKAEEHAGARANLPLWSFLVGLALVLACLEWWVYNSKVRI